MGSSEIKKKKQAQKTSKIRRSQSRRAIELQNKNIAENAKNEIKVMNSKFDGNYVIRIEAIIYTVRKV